MIFNRETGYSNVLSLTVPTDLELYAAGAQSFFAISVIVIVIVIVIVGVILDRAN